jgi:formate dehydrogenase subunit gamma
MPEQMREEEAIIAVVQSQRQRPGALRPILHDIQDSLGYVAPDAVPVIAKELNLSRAEVHGVVTFYHHLRVSPPGKHVIRICRAEACQALGANALFSHAQAVLGVELHGTFHEQQIQLVPQHWPGSVE